MSTEVICRCDICKNKIQNNSTEINIAVSEITMYDQKVTYSIKDVCITCREEFIKLMDDFFERVN